MTSNSLHSSLRLAFTSFAHIERLVVIGLLATLFGCAGAPERTQLPLEVTRQAGIPGIPDARFWGDALPKYNMERLESFTDAELRENYPEIYGQPHNYLAISGGGANGAFGAGLLLGWTATGTRPVFTVVTGVSTGAMTAPFAFLGPDYDDELKTIYTTTSTKDVIEKRNFISSLLGDAINDSTPLKELIEKYLDDDMIDAIAGEHKKGRRLYIATVNLDAGRVVIWNIGAIAVSNYPQKITLIREVLQASASIPVIFPPVMISVEANGKRYEEMHVDGGAGSQVFVYPAEMDWKSINERLKVQGRPRVYIIRNSFLGSDYTFIKQNVLNIAANTIGSLIRTQGIGDLYQIFALCERDGNDFNLAYIPSDFTEEENEAFDPVYMRKLLDLGHQMALEGYPWEKAPPGFILTN